MNKGEKNLKKAEETIFLADRPLCGKDVAMITGYFFIIAAAICWGLIGVFSGLAFSQGIQPMEVAFWRAVIAWGCFTFQALCLRQMRIDPKDLPLLSIFALLGISLFYISYQYAVKTGGVALASVLLYTAPAWVVICSYFFYREKLTTIKLTAVALVISGVFLISKSGGTGGGSVSIGFVALISGLASGFCYSLYYTIGKHFSGKYTSANLFMYLLPIGAMGILPFVEFVPKTTEAWLALVGLAVVSTFIANIFYYQGIRYLEAGRASIVATLEPVVAAVTAFIFFGEYFSIVGYMGAALIIVAVLATIWEK
ncbi:DMT family transporter [Desulfosediminicola sp.]|uniref:DMT family transporter n=2 Tax=Desulfosediminicola TaxID=2886823 RepID=UPI003AF27B3C